MAAGLGFKTFTTGEVLTAADVNGYLMQGVLVFASAAARNAAITSPQEGQFAFTKDTNGLWYYDGAAWVASGATGDIEGVTAGTGISGGGTSGTVTITNSMATEIAAKGDLIVGTGAATFDNLAVGTNGMTIVADSAEATGLKWATASGGMTLLTRASFSAVADTGTTFDAFASSTYKSYLMVIENIISSSSSDLRCQFRVGSTTQNGANYYGAAFGYNLTSTLSITAQNATTSFRIGELSTTNASAASVTFMGLGQSTVPRVTGTFWDGNRTLAGVVADKYQDTITANGIILSASAGNITGTVAIYGLASA